MHFVYQTDNLFRSIGVSDEHSCLTNGFHFFELIWTPEFLCVQNAPFKATSSIFNPLWLHLLFFSCIYWLFWAIRPWNLKAFQINSEKVESWQGIIISPTYHVQKIREGYGKNWMHFVYKMENLFRNMRVSYGNSSVTKGFHFIELIRTP